MLKEDKKKSPAAEPSIEKDKEVSNTYEQYVLHIKSNVYSMAGSFATESIKTIDAISQQLVAKHNQGVQLIEEVARLHRILNEKNIPFEQKNLKK